MSVCSILNWKLDMFVFEETGKMEHPEKKLSKHVNTGFWTQKTLVGGQG